MGGSWRLALRLSALAAGSLQGWGSSGFGWWVAGQVRNDRGGVWWYVALALALALALAATDWLLCTHSGLLRHVVHAPILLLIQ